MNRFCIAIDLIDNPFCRTNSGTRLSESVTFWEEYQSSSHCLYLSQNPKEIFFVYGDITGLDIIEWKDNAKKPTQLPHRQCISLSILDNNRVLFYGDPTGTRSFFYTFTDSHLYISSSLNYLLNFLEPKYKEISNANREYCLQFGYFPPEETAFKHINEISGATLGEFNLNSRSKEKKSSLAIKKNPNQNSSIKSLYECFMNIIEEQTKGHKTVGVLLGGFDSALVASAIAKIGKHVEAFSFRYEQKGHNQPFVDEIGTFDNISTHWVDIDSNILAPYIYNYGKISNHPTLWPGYVLQTAHLCTLMKKSGIERCFSGDGCDALFMGYPSTHNRGKFYKNAPSLPTALSKAVLHFTNALQLEIVLGHPFRIVKSILRATNINTNSRPIHSFQVLDEWAYKKLTGHNHEHSARTTQILKTIENALPDQSFERRMYIAKSLISPNRNKLNTSADYSGIPIYSPYLHPELKKLAESIPDNLLRTKNKEGKEILMNMAEQFDLLPKHIIRQKKLAAITSPIDSWMYNDFKEKAWNEINQAKLATSKLYSTSLFRDLLAEKIYKKSFSDDDVTCLAASLLYTYSSIANNAK